MELIFSYNSQVQWLYAFDFHTWEHLHLENRNSIHVVNIVHMDVKYNGLCFDAVVGGKQQLRVMDLQLESIFLPIILELIL